MICEKKKIETNKVIKPFKSGVIKPNTTCLI
jgi:hypothetical protein